MDIKKRKVDVIFNTTLVCPWDCEICCVDAVHVGKVGNDIFIKHNNLEVIETFPDDMSDMSIYEQAAMRRVERGEELSLEDKKKIIDNLSGYDAKIDISGGDALVLKDNFDLLGYASEKLGKNNVTLTATGLGTSKVDIKQVAELISEYNFTFDAASLKDIANRPNGYSMGNLKRAGRFVELGCKTRAELPLTTDIISREHLERLYLKLNEYNIDKLLIMRLFPVGRGTTKIDKIPSREEYLLAIDILKEMENKYHTPVVKLQCALRNIVPSDVDKNPCDMLSESFGITPDGKLLASPWAYSCGGKVLHDCWELGDIVQNRLEVLLSGDKAQRYYRRLEENKGHCKLFSFINSNKINPEDRLFDSADKLHCN
ncbi:putative heme d1 biosynthesis radical SAM protein NirJ1 [Yersinia intermedia]|jgi:MoaA/NifB/PqqE/SkfB family radical SAM enzyme|uniref:radical SAM protein n=1 Tax=Yersinia intermedia TaxID=631 RepID=UPI0002EAC0A3|nr:radical SAM protein [Yersinia intermedia]VDZ51384.1 putative heme d1 biosynthesis radical SAM protein NirJ1 [Yersinia intermedia]